MRPVRFQGMEVVLGKPSGMTDAECGELAIRRDKGTCISKWKLTWRERTKVFLTGSVWLGVLSGRTQPPVYLSADQPFTLDPEQARTRPSAHRMTAG